MVHSGAQEKKFLFTQSKMGSPFNIIIVTTDSVKAADLSVQCFTLIDSFNMIFSDYDARSELSRVNEAAGKGEQKLSPALLNILLLSQRAYYRSEKSFDISIGPLSLLWRNARKQKQFPDSAAVASAKALVGFSKIVLDSSRQTISLPAGAKLDLGGIGKGYIAQVVIDFLQQKGITQALADAGGDMVMSAPISGSKGWTIGVNIPETTDDLLPHHLLLQNIAVATSGDAYQYIDHNGKRYSHIIDPRTGYGVQWRRNVTIIAGHGADADWLAKVGSILPITRAKRVAKKMGAEMLITELKNGKVIYHSTRGFAKYWTR